MGILCQFLTIGEILENFDLILMTTSNKPNKKCNIIEIQ